MKTNKILALLLCLALMLPLIPAIGVTAAAEVEETGLYTEYTLTVPSTLGIEGAGWNETDGIMAQVQTGGTFTNQRYLVVTAASANEWQLKSESEDAIGYVLTTAENGEQTTAWTFLSSEINDGTTKDMGVEVEDYSDAPFGTYTDTVTFTASLEYDDVLLVRSGKPDAFMSLSELRDEINEAPDEAVAITLLRDVVLDETVAWTPITKLTGTFDGQGYTISNLTVEASADYRSAFIAGSAAGATVKDIKFENASVTGTWAAVAIYTKAANVTVSGIEVLSGQVTATTGVFAAGIAIFDGGKNTKMIVTDCKNNASVEAQAASGILVDRAGGKNPTNVTATVSRCSNTGSIHATLAWATGICFTLFGGAEVDHCYNGGEITSVDKAYGIASLNTYNGNGVNIVTYCLNDGTVTGTNASEPVYSTAVGSYYYDGNTLKTAAGVVEDDVTEALEVLNTDTYGYPAFAYDGLTERIVPADEDTAQIA